MPSTSGILSPMFIVVACIWMLLFYDISMFFPVSCMLRGIFGKDKKNMPISRHVASKNIAILLHICLCWGFLPCLSPSQAQLLACAFLHAHRLASRMRLAHVRKIPIFEDALNLEAIGIMPTFALEMMASMPFARQAQRSALPLAHHNTCITHKYYILIWTP